MTLASTPNPSPLLHHFEKRLGEAISIYTSLLGPAGIPLSVAQYPLVPDLGAVAFSTIGLGDHPLKDRTSGRGIRQELLILAPADSDPNASILALFRMAAMALAQNRCLLRGDVVAPAEPIVPNSRLTAIYVTMPVYFENDFATCTVDNTDIVVAWCVPISEGEADLVSAAGWPALEDLFVEQNPDLTDFLREPLVL